MGPGLHPRGRGEGRASFPLLLLLRRGKPAPACPCLPKGTCLVTVRKATCPKTPRPLTPFQDCPWRGRWKVPPYPQAIFAAATGVPRPFPGAGNCIVASPIQAYPLHPSQRGRLVRLRTLNFIPPYCQEIWLELGLEGTGSLVSNLCERMTSDRHPIPPPRPHALVLHTHTLTHKSTFQQESTRWVKRQD